MNWTVVWQSAIASIIASWPLFIAGLWVSHRKMREHVDRALKGSSEGDEP